jgi:hypothetical protein
MKQGEYEAKRGEMLKLEGHTRVACPSWQQTYRVRLPFSINIFSVANAYNFNDKPIVFNSIDYSLVAAADTVFLIRAR